MIKKLLFILLQFIFISNSYSKAWDLFQHKIGGFFSLQQSSTIKGIRLDSIITNGSRRDFRFNRDFSDNQIPGSCSTIYSNSGIYNQESFKDYLADNSYMLSNIYEINDTTYCQGLGISFFLTSVLPVRD